MSFTACRTECFPAMSTSPGAIRRRARSCARSSRLCFHSNSRWQSWATRLSGTVSRRLRSNALPGTFTDDMWAHQYNQEPNQVEVSLHRKPWTTDGPESNLYGLEPNFGCCAANFHQGWPKFAGSLWMASHDGGLVAAVYSPLRGAHPSRRYRRARPWKKPTTPSVARFASP